MTLNTIPLECCLYELTKRGFTPPHADALVAIIATDAEFLDRLNEYYTGPSEQGLDTFERDELLEMVATHFTGYSWPINADSQAVTRNFAERLVANALAQGWTIKEVS